MRILIVSYEAWRNSNNGGNVLSNVFGAFPDADIAQIYCSGELPQNDICTKYFQISDSSLLSKRKGRRLPEKDYGNSAEESENSVENSVKGKIPGILSSAALLARELLWSLGGWRTKELAEFVNEFVPDVIFAPCYYYYHVTKVALFVKSIAKCPMISYISDDNYSLKQFRFEPSFWINRIITRKWIRRHFAECSLVYTMTDMQKWEYESVFHRPMKVLCKSADFTERTRPVGRPVKLIYAGGLYLNRWKILMALSKAIAEINAGGHCAELHIYSGSVLGKAAEEALNDGENSILHRQIPYSELVEEYRRSDIAVHVESFDLRNRLVTRLSFSTKIIDCLSSGCAILAIGPADQAGIAYLRDNDAAVCVDDIKKVTDAVRALVTDDKKILEYSRNACLLGKKNHLKAEIDKAIRQDFSEIVSNE